MTAGLYIDGKLEFTWEQLVQNGYVTLNEDGNLTGAVKSLYGIMVIEEGVDLASNRIFCESQINGVFLPSSVTRIREGTFADNPNLLEVRCFGPMSSIDEWAFSACTSLKSFVVPDGVTVLRYGAFNYCISLESITLPDTLSVLEREAFSECAALTSITLPESVTSIDDYAFDLSPSLTELIQPDGIIWLGNDFITGSSVTNLVLPASLDSMDGIHNSALVTLDMSKVNFTWLGDEGFTGNAALTTVILPNTLESISDTAFGNCTALTSLDLPDGFVSIYDDWGPGLDTNTAVTSVVWPASLTDGSMLAQLPNLGIIYYKGSALQWDLTVSRDLFQGKTVICDYVEP